MGFTPLIPANAGTQMEWRMAAFEGRRVHPTRPERYAIWVPAFAGMSGGMDGR